MTAALVMGAVDGRAVLLLAALAAAAVIDARTRRIPNWLTAGAGAFALASAGGGLVLACAGALAAAGAGLALVAAARGAYGMGDVKLMGVAGATVGLGGVAPFLLGMALAGGAFALAGVAAGRGLHGRTMAYGPAIAAGCVVALLLRG